MLRGASRCVKQLYEQSWQSGSTYRMLPRSSVCATVRNGFVHCASNFFTRTPWARLEDAAQAPTRIVDGTIVREPGKTGSQWRILYSLRVPSLVCDFFAVTAVVGAGTGESLNRLPVVPHELILADAGYCSIAGIEHVRQQGADVLLRVNPQSFVAFSSGGSRIVLL